MSPLDQLRSDRGRDGIIVGVILGVAGFGALALTWTALASERIVPYQMPIAVSGALAGLGLIAVATVVVNVQVGRRASARRRDLLDDLATALADLAMAARTEDRAPVG